MSFSLLLEKNRWNFVGVNFSCRLQKIIETATFGTAVKVIFSHTKPPTFYEEHFVSRKRNLTKEIKLEYKWYTITCSITLLRPVIASCVIIKLRRVIWSLSVPPTYFFSNYFKSRCAIVLDLSSKEKLDCIHFN